MSDKIQIGVGDVVFLSYYELVVANSRGTEDFMLTNDDPLIIVNNLSSTYAGWVEVYSSKGFALLRTQWLKQ